MKKCTVWTNPLFCRKIHLQDAFWSDCFDFWFIRQAHLWSERGRAQEFNIKSLNLSICRLEHVVCIWFRHQSLKTAAAGHWAEMWKSQRPKQQLKEAQSSVSLHHITQHKYIDLHSFNKKRHTRLYLLSWTNKSLHFNVLHHSFLITTRWRITEAEWEAKAEADVVSLPQWTHIWLLQQLSRWKTENYVFINIK